MAGLDAEQREALLYVADLGLATCVAALTVTLLQGLIGLMT